MVFRSLTKPVLVEPARAGAEIRTYVAEEAIKKGQFVKPGGTDEEEVEPSATDGEFVYGIALYDAAVGATVAVAEGGVLVRATDGTGSITAGQALASHGATGEEGELATAASGDYVVGRAKEDGEGDGSDVIVALRPEGVLGA